MKKLAVLKCSICKREVEHEVDNTRITPVKCTITLRCGGTLTITGYRSVRTAIHTATSQEYRDWIKRGTPPPKSEPTPVGTVSIKAGSNHLALALAGATEQSVDLRFKTPSMDENTTTKSYYYIRGATTGTIAGSDDSDSRVAMRIGDGDLTKVFLNGEEMSAGPEPEKYTTTTDRITFNTPLADEKNVIIVLVYKPIEQIERVVTFTRTGTTSGSSWGNVDGVTIGEMEHDVYVASDLSGLKLGEAYVLAEQTFTYTEACLLVANKPYSSFDRLMTVHVPLTEDVLFEYLLDRSSEPQLTVSETDVHEIFPPIGIVGVLHYPDFTIESEGIVRSTIKTTRVIGPV